MLVTLLQCIYLFTLSGPQNSYENVVLELREKLDESKGEIRELQSEVEHFQEDLKVKSRSETGVLHNEPMLTHSEQTADVLPSDEVSTSSSLDYEKIQVFFG